MVDEQQHAARLHDACDLIQHGLRVELRPRGVRPLVHPIEVVVHLDDEHRIERGVGQRQMLELYPTVLDVWQAVLGEALLPAVVAPVIGRQVVEHQHVSARADNVARELAVVAVGCEQIADLHTGLEAARRSNSAG